MTKKDHKKEEKNKKQQYGHERYKNVFKDEKQRVVKYRKEILLNAEKQLLIDACCIKLYLE